MSTGDPDYDDGYVNDYDTNTSFDQTDVSSMSERDEREGEEEGDDTQHEEYLSYSSMVDVAVKSNGQMLATHNHIVDGIPVFAFSEGYVWIGDTKHGVHVRDVKNFETKKQLGTINMRCMAIVENDVWVGYCNGDIKIYDKNNLDSTPKEVASSSSRASIDCITYSNGIVWTGSADWELRARRQTNGSSIRSLPDGHRDWIRSIVVAGPNLWSSGDDSLIILWDAETGEKVRTLELKSKNSMRIKCSILCVVGNTVWGGCADGMIRIWNLDGEYQRRFRAHKAAVTSLVCAGSHVWSGGYDNTVKIWERENLELIETITLKFPVLTMGMHGTQVYMGGRKVIQVRMTSGLLEYLRDNYHKLDQDYLKLLAMYKSLLEKYEAAEPERMRELLDQIKAERDAMESDLIDLQKERDMAFERIRALEESGAQRERELEELLQESRDKMQETEQEAAEHRTKAENHEATIADHEATIAGHEETISKHMARIAEHEEKVKEHERQVAEHEARVNEREARIAEHEAKIAEHETKITEHEGVITGHEDKIKNYEEKLQQQDGEKEKLVQQAESLQSKIDELQAQLQEARENGARSSEDNNRQGAHNQELLEKVAKLEEAKAKLEQEKTKLQQQEALVGEVVTVTENKLKGEKEKQARLEQEVHRLKDLVRQRDDSITVHRKELEVAQSSLINPQQVFAVPSKRPFAEKCAEFVIFILCSCLILAVLVYLHLASYSHSYEQIFPN